MPDMQVPGLLSSQENDFARQQGMMNAAGALMKGAEWSVIPKSPFAAIGDALQQYNTGYNGAADQLLKREQLRGTIDARKLTILNAIASYRGAGLPVPPLLLNMLGGDASGVGGMPSPGATVGGPGGPGATVGGGMPQAGGAAPAPQGMPSAPGMPAGLLSPQPTAQTPAPNLPQPTASAAPPPMDTGTTGGAAPALPGGVAGVIRTLPQQDRYALIGGGPAGKIVQGVLEKNLAKTEAQKNGEASGGLNPLQYTSGVKNAELPNEVKVAAAAGFGNDVAGFNAWQKQAEGLAAEKAKHVGTYIQGINPAKQSIDTLNTMEDALDRAGDKITTGPYANEMLKLKQFAQNAGVPVDGLPEAEVVSKLNAYLAGQATKAISSRPAQFEFQTYLKNNPGLLNSVQGTKKLIDVLRQQQTHALDLGQLALDDKNLKNFGDVEQNYYKTHPIISPFSNLPLGERPNLPQGSQFNRKLMQYRDPKGNLYDAAGKPVAPGQQSDAGSPLRVADAGGGSVPPLEIEDILAQHSQGALTNGQARKALPPGWSVDFRGKQDAYKVIGPDGRFHHIWGSANGASGVG